MDAIDKKKQPKITEDTPEALEAELRSMFHDAFYEEAKEIEAEMVAFDLEMDAEQKARLKAKVMARFVAVEEAERAAKTVNEMPTTEIKSAGTSVPGGEPKAVEVAAYADAAGEEDTDTTEDKSLSDGNVISGVAISKVDDEKKRESKGKRSHIHVFKRIAVAAAVVCVAMVGITVQSQAGKDGIWSSIQRLIGSDSRWELKNNGEDRQYTDTEEWKAIAKIEEDLGMDVPEFYYWPNDIDFVRGEIEENSGYFTMIYRNERNTIYFQGWKAKEDTSELIAFEDGEESYVEKHEGVDYMIMEHDTDNSEYPKMYSVTWMVNSNKFLLSNIDNMTELEEILKNIKN